LYEQREFLKLQYLLEKDFLHLDLMRGVLTDTHFTQRGRLGRLITFVSRMQADGKPNDKYPIVGIGVDERTTLCVEANGHGHVLSCIPDGRAWFVMPEKKSEVLREGDPLTIRDVKVVCAGPGSEVDLLKRVVSKAATEMTASVITGDLSTRP
jgi:beta-aspartyl-peptidase (threonine type)